MPSKNLTAHSLSEPLEQLIEILENHRIKGEKYTDLSTASLEFLFEERCLDRPPNVSSERTPAVVDNIYPSSLSFRNIVRNPLGGSSKSSKNCTAGSIAVKVASTSHPPATLSDTDIVNGQVKSTFVPEKLDLNIPLPELARTVSECQRCRLCHGRTRTIFGAGNSQADLMFIGDGPTHEDDQAGSPFTDKSGALLNKMITAMGFSKDDVYITNMTKCSPPTKRPPADDELESCLPYIKREIELIQPKVIVLLGPTPAKALLGKQRIAKIRGQWHKYNEIDCMPTYHPSYLLRISTAKREVWADLKLVMQKLGK